VKLDNGKEIAAKKLVASSTDPSTLILKHIGEDYLEKPIIEKVKKIEWGDAIMAIYLALNDAPEYYAGAKVSDSSQIHLSGNTIDSFAKTYYQCRSRILPSDPLAIMSNDSACDPSRVPQGKHLIKFLILNVPYKIKEFESDGVSGRIMMRNSPSRKTRSNSQDWSEYIKEHYADYLINMITQKYMPNLKKIMIKKVVFSPIDFETRPSTSVRGTLACGALVPYQKYSMRPIPELAGYKVNSIPNIYLCGSGSHPGPGVSMAPGRNAAQVIFANLNLDFSKIVAERY